MTHNNGKTQVKCTYFMRSLSRDAAKHESCDQEHGKIVEKCKANVYSAGGANERAECTFQAIAAGVSLKCVDPGTSTPLAMDASLNDEIER